MPNPPLKVYGLGEHGVDLVSTPLHAPDGSLTQAQNAEFFKDQGVSGLRKRQGLQRLNSANALAGQVNGFVGVPLPAIPFGNTNNRPYLISTGAAEWSRATAADAAVAVVTGNTLTIGTGGSAPAATGGRQPIVSFKGRIYYAVEDGSSNHLGVAAFDGVTESIVYPSTTAIVPIGIHNNQIALSDGGSNVVLLNPATGAVKTISLGANWNGFGPVNQAVSWLGKVWIAGGDGTPQEGRVGFAHENDASFTSDRLAGANKLTYTSVAVYGGQLYASQYASAGTAALIEVRTAAGSWSTSLTAPSSANANFFNNLIVHGGELYAVFNHGSDAPIVYKFDGGSWTADETLDADSQAGSAVSLGTDLFVSLLENQIDGGITGLEKPLRKRDSAGTWSTITNGASLLGLIGRIQ